MPVLLSALRHPIRPIERPAILLSSIWRAAFSQRSLADLLDARRKTHFCSMHLHTVRTRSDTKIASKFGSGLTNNCYYFLCSIFIPASLAKLLLLLYFLDLHSSMMGIVHNWLLLLSLLYIHSSMMGFARKLLLMWLPITPPQHPSHDIFLEAAFVAPSSWGIALDTTSQCPFTRMLPLR